MRRRVRIKCHPVCFLCPGSSLNIAGFLNMELHGCVISDGKTLTRIHEYHQDLVLVTTAE
jgi:hypothetical protein